HRIATAKRKQSQLKKIPKQRKQHPSPSSHRIIAHLAPSCKKLLTEKIFMLYLKGTKSKIDF
ncbi:MAG: hypothetical protein IJW22_07155, partial [Clostridia bacterium]|nr:hypothetical protein [Clostridia bacterium]